MHNHSVTDIAYLTVQDVGLPVYKKIVNERNETSVIFADYQANISILRNTTSTQTLFINILDIEEATISSLSSLVN